MGELDLEATQSGEGDSDVLHPVVNSQETRTERTFFDYYGLTEQPFGVTPDPRFLYLGRKHQEALTALVYGTETNRGFLTLIAKPGMGKTSLLFQYLERQREKARSAFVFQTNGDPRDLMRYVLADLGLDGAGKDLPEMHSILNQVLTQEIGKGRRFILVIDEAQNLDEKGLESVRLLSNFETPWTKLMHIVLAGQPQLAERLAQPSMAQLCQRISFFIRIEPFTSEEVDAYIDHRLWVAGYKGPSLFTVGARRLIAEHSEGVPRNINKICFAAMSLGWASKHETIGEGVVTDILPDLSPGPLTGSTAVVSKSKEEPHRGISPLLFPTGESSPQTSWPLNEDTVVPKSKEELKQAITPVLLTTGEGSQQTSWPLTKEDKATQEPAEEPKRAVPQVLLTLNSGSRFRGWLPRLVVAAVPLLALGWFALHGNGSSQALRLPLSRPANVGSQAPTPESATVDATKSSPRISWAEPKLVEALSDKRTQKALPASAQKTTDGTDSIIVASGETLYRICVKNFGKCDGDRLKAIGELNPSIDPEHLEPGQQIRVPSANETEKKIAKRDYAGAKRTGQ